MHDHREELLEDYNQQQHKEREVFRELTASYMMSSPLERFHEVLNDRQDRIKNATANTPDHVGSTEVRPKAVLEENVVSFLTNRGNTRSHEENSTSNQLSDLKELLFNLKAQPNYLERIQVHEEEASEIKLTIDRINENPTVLHKDKAEFNANTQLSLDTYQKKLVIYVVKDLG